MKIANRNKYEIIHFVFVVERIKSIKNTVIKSLRTVKIIVRRVGRKYWAKLINKINEYLQ